MNIDLNYVEKLLLEVLAIPSISGECGAILARLEKEFEKLEIPVIRTRKGALIGKWEGREEGEERLVSAHVDTLGAVVRQIKPNGRLRLLPIGGFAWASLEGENVLVRSLDGREFTGSLLPEKSSVHMFSDVVRETLRDEESMEVRLDVVSSSREETENLGIRPGDFVFFDPRPVITPEGFLKARFLDDKACVAVLFGVLHALKRDGLVPSKTVHFYLSDNEEIGHGISFIPERVEEIVALDIGIVAEGTASSEQCVSIAARDSKSTYHLALRRYLTVLAEKYNIDYRTDVYYRYGSDATACILRGVDATFACFGPGVDATHHYERTHRKALEATAKLLMAYVTS